MPGIRLPALIGQMGDRTFYLSVMKLRQAARFFEATPMGIPAEQRAQRPLNDRRVPEITQYLLSRDESWVFGCLTVSYDGEAEFRNAPRDDKLGYLELDADTEFVIVDGQHRLAAIQAALRENPQLGEQKIGVMLLPFEDLTRNQQVFSDLNRTVQKTSRSLDILYDHSDPLNGIVMSVGTRVPIFRQRVEKNSQSLALRSPRLVTLSSLYDGCQQLLGGESAVKSLGTDEGAVAAEELAVDFWSYISHLIMPWAQVESGELKPSEARTEYVAAHSVAFFALGYAGARILEIEGLDSWKEHASLSRLDGLAKIDWTKTNPEWQGIVMLGHHIVTRRQTRTAMGRFICHKLAPRKFPPPPTILE